MYKYNLGIDTLHKSAKNRDLFDILKFEKKTLSFVSFYSLKQNNLMKNEEKSSVCSTGKEGATQPQEY